MARDDAPPADDPGAWTDGFDPDFVRRLAPLFRRLRSYFRLQADGLQHVPRHGPALLVANHTGWLGLDYAMTALSVHDETGRFVRGLVHPAWFSTTQTGDFARRVGLVEVSKDAMRELLEAGQLAMVFPEGEKGAFRPGTDYAPQEFARGFIRVAMDTGVPIVPVCVLGGAESNPVHRRVDSYEKLLRLSLPVPKNLLPRPVKWRLRFLPPVHLPTDADPGDRETVHAAAGDVRQRIADGLDRLVEERGHPYL